MKPIKIIISIVSFVLSISCTQKSSQPEQVEKPIAVDLKDSPNILLIMSDDLNTNIGPYMDIKNHTPNLDKLAEKGIKFSNMYCQYPLCGPSRASFMSGLYPERNKVLSNIDKIGSYRASTPSLKNHPSMAGFFREQGYYTARVSKIFHMGVPGGIERGDSGADDPDSWDYVYNVLGPETMGPGQLELLSPGNLHYGSNFSRMIISNESVHTQTDYLATSQAIAILENRAATLVPNTKNLQRVKKDAPFFLAVGLVRPHVPLIAPERCFDNYPVNKVQVPVVINDNVPKEALGHTNAKIWKMNTEQKKKTISAYMASVQFMDEQVGRLLQTLDRLDLRKKTIVVFVSDHGYNLGEHDAWSKISLWEGSVRVPFVISVPGNESQKGKDCKTIAELIDIYPTLTELCGLSKNQPAILQGNSLVSYLKNANKENKDAVAYTVSEAGTAASIRTKQWRYTRWGEKSMVSNEELYNHITDPEEYQNLIESSENSSVVTEMRLKFDRAKSKALTH